MRVDRYSIGSLPTPSLNQSGSKNREPKRFDAPEESPTELDTPQQRKPATEIVSLEQRARQYESVRLRLDSNAMEAYVHVGEHARRDNTSPRAARALATYQNLAQLPQREQLVKMFGVDAYA